MLLSRAICAGFRNSACSCSCRADRSKYQSIGKEPRVAFPLMLVVVASTFPLLLVLGSLLVASAYSRQSVIAGRLDLLAAGGWSLTHGALQDDTSRLEQRLRSSQLAIVGKLDGKAYRLGDVVALAKATCWPSPPCSPPVGPQRP